MRLLGLSPRDGGMLTSDGYGIAQNALAPSVGNQFIPHAPNPLQIDVPINPIRDTLKMHNFKRWKAHLRSKSNPP